MKSKTVTRPNVGNEERGKPLMAALAAAGCPPVPKWSNTTRVGRDGYLVAMPKDEKRRDQLAHKPELEQEERDAARDGDHHRAAWARQQASQECGARRPAKQPRARGAGRPKVRSSARRSSERSGDSGDSEQPEPPPPERRCEFCGADISHRGPKALYCKDAHGAIARKRRERSRNRDWTADVSRADPYLRRDPEEVAWLLRRLQAGCRCNGHHILDETGIHCIKCGRDRGHDHGGRVYIWARSAETRRPRKPELSA